MVSSGGVGSNMLGSSQMMLLALAVREEFKKISGFFVHVTHLLETRNSERVNSLYANMLHANQHVTTVTKCILSCGCCSFNQLYLRLDVFIFLWEKQHLKANGNKALNENDFVKYLYLYIENILMSKSHQNEIVLNHTQIRNVKSQRKT